VTFGVIHLLHAFSNVLFRTCASHGPSAIAERFVSVSCCEATEAVGLVVWLHVPFILRRCCCLSITRLRMRTRASSPLIQGRLPSNDACFIDVTRVIDEIDEDRRPRRASERCMQPRALSSMATSTWALLEREWIEG